MNLSSLIGDYQICTSRLFAAIEAEDLAVIRELDIQMSWLRKTIRDFPALSESDRRRQIDFFLDLLTKTTDQQRNVPPISDLRTIIDRTITATAQMPRGGTGRLGARLARADEWDDNALAQIENSGLRLSVLGRDMRFRYNSPANCRFHNVTPKALEGTHLADLIGRERYENRVRAYLERCFAGEDLSYCYYLDSPTHGRMLMECRMLAQYDDHGGITGAIVIMRDLTHDCPDPVRSAEENRV